jgi:hypothetical protein
MHAPSELFHVPAVDVLLAHGALARHTTLLGEQCRFGRLQLRSELACYQSVSRHDLLFLVDDQVEAFGQQVLEHAAKIVRAAMRAGPTSRNSLTTVWLSS